MSTLLAGKDRVFIITLEIKENLFYDEEESRTNKISRFIIKEKNKCKS